MHFFETFTKLELNKILDVSLKYFSSEKENSHFQILKA